MSAVSEKDLDEAGGLVEADPTSLTGEQLPALIYAEADRRGISLGVVADMLGMSRPYLFRLRHYPPSCQKISRNYIDKIALFLGVPVVCVMVAAGQLRADDLTFQDDDSRKEIDRAIRYMREDPAWSVMLTDVDGLNDGLKSLIVRCYEREEGRKLLTNRNEGNSLLNILFRKIRDESRDPPNSGNSNATGF